MTRLGDVLTEAQPGFACGTQDDKGVLQFRMNNVTRTGSLDLSKRRRVPRSAHKRLESFLLRDGDVVFNSTNSPDGVGRAGLIQGLDEPAVFSNHFYRLRSDPERLAPGYLVRWLNWNFHVGVFKGMCRQWVNQATVARESLLDMSFDLPPIEEQRRIAAILDHADVLAARCQRRLVHLTHLDAAVYQTFIGQAEWPKRPIGDIATKVGSGATPRGGSKAYKDEGVALIRSMNVHDGRFSWKDLARLDAVQARGLDNVVVEEDDVLLNITGASVARVTRAPATVLPARVNQHVAIIRPRAATIAPRILEQHLMSPKVKRDLLRLAGAGATREAITKAEILKLVVPIPDSAAQDAYLAAATALDVQRERALAMAKSGSQLKSSLQAQAFSGRL